MKLKEFIKELQVIEKEKGGEVEVLMADNIPVVSPKFSKEYPGLNSCVIITDQE